MTGTKQSLLDVVEIDLEDLTVYVNVWDNSLARKWLASLNTVLQHNLHLEKNYCFLGFATSPRNGAYLCEQINASIQAINASNINYTIQEQYHLDQVLRPGPVGDQLPGGTVQQEYFNRLHRYFEDLQGTAHAPSRLYAQANANTKWHIRQLNLLCHEFESWAMSWRKSQYAEYWQRPSQLMCWLTAPRYTLEESDLELFGIDTINRSLGGVYVGVNKAVGKHHWEVFCDEGRDSRIGELTTTSLSAQTLAAADFDIEWANNPGAFPWQIRQLAEFREWLVANGFDPADPTLTIGHPQVGQIDLARSFGTEDYRAIWAELNTRLNVTAVRTSDAGAEYPYTWADPDYPEQQQRLLK
jgi:hypothetical protein